MPHRCVVPNCRSNYPEQKEKVPTFGFPRCEERRRLWLSKINRENFVISRHSVVCIKHFDEQFIVRFDSATRDDGSILTVERTKPKLTNDAHPTMIPPYPTPPANKTLDQPSKSPTSTVSVSATTTLTDASSSPALDTSPDLMPKSKPLAATSQVQDASPKLISKSKSPISKSVFFQPILPLQKAVNYNKRNILPFPASTQTTDSSLDMLFVDKYAKVSQEVINLRRKFLDLKIAARIIKLDVLSTPLRLVFGEDLAYRNELDKVFNLVHLIMNDEARQEECLLDNHAFTTKCGTDSVGAWGRLGSDVTHTPVRKTGPVSSEVDEGVTKSLGNNKDSSVIDFTNQKVMNPMDCNSIIAPAEDLSDVMSEKDLSPQCQRVGEKHHKEIVPTICELCGLVLASNDQLTRHMDKHEKPYECSECGEEFVYKKFYDLHLKESHPSLKHFKCDQCPKSFRSRHILSQHVRQVHKKNKNLVPCTFCPHKSRNRAECLRHMKVHSGPKPFRCESCYWGSSTEAGLLSHVEKGNCKKRKIAPRICEYCDKVFHFMRELAIHKREVHKYTS